ncbi:MAG: folate-binding protein [Rhodobacteraceae bacterium]|nr:folate-binding protein [Paracoccaceae bacterium]
MTGELAAGRRVLRIAGQDREGFLQGLVTNDLRRLRDGPVYAALLTPQGKYLADFFLVPDGDSILLDVRDILAEGLLRRLAMYRLRADVRIGGSGLHVLRGLGPAPAGAFADPRDPALGWRLWTTAPGGPAAIDWDAIRVERLVPESGIELVPEETYILEAGFERLHGVDFRKGCYVGQEVTARMKHRTELRKGLVRLRLDAPVAPGTPILAGGRPAGTLFTRSGLRALAHLRHDLAGGALTADGVALHLDALRPDP